MHVADLCLHLLAHSLPGCLEGFPLLRCLVTRVKARPRIAAYLASERYACTDKCLYQFLLPLPSSLFTYFRTSLLYLTYSPFTIRYLQVRQHRQVLSARLVLAEYSRSSRDGGLDNLEGSGRVCTHLHAPGAVCTNGIRYDHIGVRVPHDPHANSVLSCLRWAYRGAKHVTHRCKFSVYTRAPPRQQADLNRV